MERKLRKRTMANLVMSTVVLIIYFVFLLTYNFYYICGLNNYFEDVNKDVTRLAQVNIVRVAANTEFIRYEIGFAVLGAVLVMFEANCIRKLLKLYENLAFKDILTGCYSRESLEAFFEKTEKKKNIGNLTYFLFDLNYLKELNEEYGRNKGDEFLRAMAKCLKNVFAGLPIYRIGGEEFAVIYTGEMDPKAFIDRVNDEIDNWNWKLNETDITLSFAKGYARDAYDYTDRKYRETIYKKASSAMHKDATAFKRILPKAFGEPEEEKEVNLRTL